MQGREPLDTQTQRKYVYEPSKTTEPKLPSASRPKGTPFFAHLITFLILFCLWILLSGKFDLFHLSLGIISCIIVTLLSGDLLFPESKINGFIGSWLRFLRYLPWLLYQIFLANLHILYLVFHPRMMDLIDPQIIKFQSKLTKELSLVTFANSITLTPGTITVYVSVDGYFHVHSIDEKSGKVLPGEMESKIAKAFGEQ